VQHLQDTKIQLRSGFSESVK